MSSPIDAAGYLLGELGPDERAEAERRMRTDPAFAREVDRLRPVLVGLEDLPTEAWERLEPPPIVLPEGAPSAGPGLMERLRVAFAGTGVRVATGAVAVVAALAVGFGVGVLAGGDDTPTPERTLTLAGLPEAPGAEGTAQVFAAASGTGELEVDVTGLAPSGPDEVYELWLLNTPADLRSLGTFTVPESGTASVSVPLPVPPEQFAVVDVSRETLGGDPSHSGRSVLRADTA